MSLARSLALSVLLSAPLCAQAQEPVAEMTVGYVIPYLPEDLSKRDMAMPVTEGVDGAPDHIELGMIIRVIDKDDPSLSAIGEVTGNVGDGVTVSDTSFVLTFIAWK